MCLVELVNRILELDLISLFSVCSCSRTAVVDVCQGQPWGPLITGGNPFFAKL
jgi:hypothetical protein